MLTALRASVSPVLRRVSQQAKDVARRVRNQCRAVLRGSPQPLDRARIARAYLQGRGLEIGALFNPMPLPAHARAAYVDRLPVAQLREHYPDLANHRFVEVDIVDDGERLATVADDSQDFLIASHFLEHCQDPIGALKNFFRVLRDGGVLFLAVPDKRYTFDRERPVTSFAHLLRDHFEGPAWSRWDHYYEFMVLANKVPPGLQAEQAARGHLDMGYSIHFHVWTQTEFLQLLEELKPALGYELELFLKNGLEMIAILRKGRGVV